MSPLFEAVSASRANELARLAQKVIETQSVERRASPKDPKYWQTINCTSYARSARRIAPHNPEDRQDRQDRLAIVKRSLAATRHLGRLLVVWLGTLRPTASPTTTLFVRWFVQVCPSGLDCPVDTISTDILRGTCPLKSAPHLRVKRRPGYRGDVIR